jgi:YidC/Oxa1 family membrane protein insertase
VLLYPTGTGDPYFAQFGWVAKGDGVKVPGAGTLWTSSGGTLTPKTPVTLTWDNGAGLTFMRTISVDDVYMFTVKDAVKNTGNATVNLVPYALISRTGTPQVSGYYILFEGLLGKLGSSIQEAKYSSLTPGKPENFSSTGGWLGFTDKYWLTALIPAQDSAIDAKFVHTHDNGVDRYQTDFTAPPIAVEPNATAENSTRFFAGAKELNTLEAYGATGIPLFDYAIDFGWFWFLTKPIFKLLLIFEGLIGNFGIAILLLTLIIKLAFFPLANKSYQAMSKMKLLQPEMQKIRERFPEDKARQQQEIMAMYKRVGANPLAGCLPIVLQIPVFFSLYKVLFVTIEMRHAPFYGWIHDLSSPDPTSFVNLFGLLPFHPPHMLMIGAWPIIMGITMFLQQKLNPQPVDPVQAKMFMFLPVVFTYMLSAFPAGLVIYWAWNNTLSIAQQWAIMHRAGAA